jgi:hypothetical protein
LASLAYEDEEFNLEVTAAFKGTGRANSGISMIVPVDAVKNLLEVPALKAQRESVAAGMPRQADTK